MNDVPVAQNGSVTTEQNTAVDLILNADEVDGDDLSFIVTVQPTKGVLSGSGKSLTYTPNVGEIGMDTFKFKANDGISDSNVATINVNIMDNGNWHLTSWGNRRKIHINNSTQGALTNMPVLVRLNSSRINYANVNNDGSDIRFVDQNGANLSYEISKWTQYGESLVWVKVPSISANSVVNYIWMYYNNESATSDEDASNVWSNGYVAVYHLNSTPYKDSKNNFNLNQVGTVTLQSSSKVGSGAKSSGSAHYLSSPDLIQTSGQGLNPTNLTIETWSNETTRSSNSILVDKANQYSLISKNGKIKMMIGGTVVESDSAEIPTNSWQYLSGVFNTTANTCVVYRNGIQRKSGTCNNEIGATAQPLNLLSNNSAWFNGVLDEVRISSVVRTADWLRAQYLSVNDSYLIIGSEQTYGASIIKSQLSVISSTLDDGLVSDGTRSYDNDENRQGNGYRKGKGSGCAKLGICSDFSVWGYNRFQLNQPISSGANIISSYMRLYGTSSNGWNSNGHSLGVMVQNSKTANRISSNNQCPDCSTNVPIVSSAQQWKTGSGLAWNIDNWNNSPQLNQAFNLLISGQNGLDSGEFIQIWTNRYDNYGSNVINVQNEDFSSENNNHAQFFIEWID